LLNDILDFSKVEAGRLDLETLDLELTSLLDDLVSSLALRARQKGLALRCAAEPAVPKLLRGDPGRLRQILTNLAGNAIKFTRSGEVAIRVSLEEASRREVLLRFSVRDTGIGIPAHKLGLLFNKFSQVDASTTRQYGGTGLGLAISKQLAGLMGGEVGVSSEEGKGSEFWFTARLATQAGGDRPVPGLDGEALALAGPEQAAQAPRPDGARHAARELLGRFDGCKARILLVEDNITNQQVAIGILRKFGLRVDAVANGAEALEALAGLPYDLVLMDVQMPVMDGLEAARQIRGPGSAVPDHQVPIIAMTAHAMQGDRERCLAAGMNGYLTKPIAPQALAEALSSWLPKSDPRR
jgi:CheY-like chemotaxis protein